MRADEEDQVRAAIRETLQRMERQAATHPDSAITNSHPDPWVRALVTWYERLITTDRARWCSHLRAGVSPRPIHATAWIPGLVACDLCVALGVFVVTGRADRLCDRCGKDTLGEGIYNGAASLGALTIDYGLCPACFHHVKRSMEGER